MNLIFDPFWALDWKKVTQPHLSDQKVPFIGENLERKIRIFFLAGLPTIYHFARIAAFQIHLRCFVPNHDILKIESFWCWFFWLDNLKGVMVLAFPVSGTKSYSGKLVAFCCCKQWHNATFFAKILTWYFKKFLAAKKIIAALILGSESNIFRRCSWHFTSASTFSLSSGNPITSVSSLQQMKSPLILVKSCADYNTISFPLQVGLI